MAETSAPAKVLEVLGRTGVRGDIIQVRCEVLDGKEAGKILVRNVKGPIKAGDTLHLLETVMQARRAEGPRKKTDDRKKPREER
ncbi:MAG: 30S ribosomal protein S28e [archaeon]